MDRRKFFEFTGKISTASFYGSKSHFIIQGENGENRLFEAPGSDYGNILSKESDEERHIRYDIEMDTNMVFTICEFTQWIVSYRWKIMRQFSELVRYVLDQTRVEEHFGGGQQKATVWIQKLQPIVDFPITEEIIDKIEKELNEHPDVVAVDRNGGWFTITAKFY